MISKLVAKIKADPSLAGDVVFHRIVPGREAKLEPFPDSIPEQLRRGLESMGIGSLYSHQAQAVRLSNSGANVAVVTPTASGKTLSYNIPVFSRALTDPRSRAVYVFPTKALEQDQKKAIDALAAASGIAVRAEVYDGDTTQYRRRKIRSDPPQILITNPDMIHLGILPYHDAWEEYIRNLSYVVLDEIHTYKGVFGSHIVQILRRLRRVASRLGADPRFVACSATIGNPGQFASTLTGLEFDVVDKDGSPASDRHFLFVNPVGSSPYTLSARLFATAIEAGFKTIAFTKARKITELMHSWVARARPAWRDRISSYRAGFLPTERREIESRMFSGELDGVISTSALEVGIDIGGLDVCVLVGYPGTLVNSWQRGGRVGRGKGDSLVILVAQQDALDQYFMRHPEQFFDRSFEAAVVDPGNRRILEAHLECAATEFPIAPAIEPFRGPEVDKALESLSKQGKLLPSADGKRYFPARLKPHRDVDIRSIGRGFSILEDGTRKVIGSVSGSRAWSECHEGAIYLHRGQQYAIKRVDIEAGNVYAGRVEADYYTRTLGDKETEILETVRRRPAGRFVANFGRLKVTETITGYQKRGTFTQETISQHPLEMPPMIFETVGLWIEIPHGFADVVADEGGHFMGGIHACEHAMIALFPLFALCDPGDIGGISQVNHPQVGGPAVFVYDGQPGGVGLSERGFEVIETLVEKTLRTVSECPCETGCPSCIHSPRCGSGNVPLDKRACVRVLEMLLDRNCPPAVVPESGPDDPGEEPEAECPKGPEAELSMIDAVVLDVETQRSAADVGGWGNAHLMRVAVAVTYHSKTGDYRSWYEKDVDDLVEMLLKARVVVGFNIDGFDFKVLSGYAAPQKISGIRTFDILADVKNRLGFRLSLSALARETLGADKSADGLQSLAWFKAGEIGKVRDYCEQDVRITLELYLFGLKNGFLLYERKGEKLRLPVDWKVPGEP